MIGARYFSRKLCRLNAFATHTWTFTSPTWGDWRDWHLWHRGRFGGRPFASYNYRWILTWLSSIGNYWAGAWIIIRILWWKHMCLLIWWSKRRRKHRRFHTFSRILSLRRGRRTSTRVAFDEKQNAKCHRCYDIQKTPIIRVQSRRRTKIRLSKCTYPQLLHDFGHLSNISITWASLRNTFQIIQSVPS